MIKRKNRFLIVVLALFLLFYVFHIPGKALLFFTQVLIKQQYGVNVSWEKLNGGFLNYIKIEKFKVIDDNYPVLECESISTNIEFKDIIFPKPQYLYFVHAENPKFYVHKNYSLQVNTPILFLNRKMKIIISNAEASLWGTDKTAMLRVKDISGEMFHKGRHLVLSLESENELTKITGRFDLDTCMGQIDIENAQVEFPLAELPTPNINGNMRLGKEGLEINNGTISLGDLSFSLTGNILPDRKMDLIINPLLRDKDSIVSRSVFYLKGSIDEPEIITDIGMVGTSFKVKGVKYIDGALVFTEIRGDIKIPGFVPLKSSGMLIIGSDFFGFKNVTLAKVLNIDGVISRANNSKLNMWIKNAKGADIAEELPEALKPLLSAHTLDAKMYIYGKINELQGSGILKIFSKPIDISCRYRKNKISFNSITEGPFNLFGSIYFSDVITTKINGKFSKMDFSELLGFFGGNTASDVKGVVNGEFKIAGEINDPTIKAKLEIEDGKCGDIKFDILYLNLEGTVYRLNLKHSLAYYKEIPAELTGYIDTKSDNLFANLEILPAKDLFMWKGVNVKKDSDDRIVEFGQDVNENVSVHFKSPLSSDPEKDALNTDPEVEVKYKILDDKSILIKMEEEEGTVGLEQKVKF